MTAGSHISTAQAAGYISISRAAIHKAINAGTLKALKIGNVVVVNKQSAIEYRRRREAAAEAPQDRQTVEAAGKAKKLRAPGRRARSANR